jgi:Asp-tRNA(Asn)/Glu-tRNA(Gln) amidotransferase A subunit family amidase
LAGRKCTAHDRHGASTTDRQTTEALNAIVAALHAAAAKADEVQLDAVNDVYADHVVQVMATSLRRLNRLLGQLVEGQPAEQSS